MQLLISMLVDITVLQIMLASQARFKEVTRVMEVWNRTANLMMRLLMVLSKNIMHRLTLGMNVLNALKTGS